MKTGLIIYVVGNDTANFINDVTLQGQIPAWADIVEIVAQNNGHYDIHDAWWKLIARGMQRIICKIAEITDSVMSDDYNTRLTTIKIPEIKN